MSMPDTNIMDSLDTRETELTVIGMAMNYSDVAKRVADLPEDTMQSDDTFGLHKAIKKIVNAGGIPELAPLLAECPELTDTISDAMTRGFTNVGYMQLETILLNKRRKVRVKKACVKALNKIESIDSDPQAIVNEFIKATEDDFDRSSMTVSMEEAVIQTVLELDEATKEKCMTGIAGLDQLIGGMRSGKLIYIGARPGVGKTALALYIAMHVAHKQGRVLYSSLEMTPSELTERILSAWSNVDVAKMDSGRLTADDYMELTKVYQPVSNMKLSFTNEATSPLLLRRICSQMASEPQGLNMVVVDYIQLMKSDEKATSRYEQVSAISRELKLLAMDLNIPIIVLTQFNRASETNVYGKVTKRKPSMAESKDSGSIEQDANIFMTLYAPEEPQDSSSWAWACWNGCKQRGTEWQIISVDKNRQGKQGYVDVEFDKPHMVFKTLINDTGKR